MPITAAPEEGDLGIISGGTAMIPISVPASYVPAAGEYGIQSGGIFLPIEPLYSTPLSGDGPWLEVSQEIEREPPFYDQVDMRVATPCVAPYNWTESTANRTLILDTLPEALCGTDEKATAGYVPNPGLTLSSKTHADFDATSYDDGTGVGYRWHYGTAPGTPQPALRAGQTRYTGYGTAASGTEYTGTAFLPGDAGSFVSGTLNITAYRYGLLLSDTSKWPVKVKVGKGSAAWDQGSSTLTLTTPTSYGTLFYGTSGTADTRYAGALSLTDTATVTWHGTKANMVASDTWTTTVTFTDGTGPEDFTETKYSTLPTYSNTPVQTLVRFQRKPDFYISPNGTGDGLTPSTPSNATTVIGLTTATGLAVGARSIATAKSGTAALQLTRGGANPTGSVMKYSLDGSTWGTYSTPVNHTAPGRIWFKLERSGGAALSPTWNRPWFLGSGTGVQINALWDLSEKTLTLAYEPTPLVASDVQILYSLDGSTPAQRYTGPIAISTACTPKVKAVHAVDAGVPSDFAASTGTYDCTTIDPDATADYDEDHAVTWTADATVASYTFSRGGDVVWACEGTYTNPTDSASNYFSNSNAIVIKGGYSSDFTERDVISRKTIIKSVAFSGVTNTSLLSLSSGVIDGLHGEAERLGKGNGNTYIANVFTNLTAYNCHFSFNETSDGTNTGNRYSFDYIFSGSKAYNCTVNYRSTWSQGSSGFTNSHRVFIGQMYNSTVAVSLTLTGSSSSDPSHYNQGVIDIEQLVNSAATIDGSIYGKKAGSSVVHGANLELAIGNSLNSTLSISGSTDTNSDQRSTITLKGSSSSSILYLSKSTAVVTLNAIGGGDNTVVSDCSVGIRSSISINSTAGATLSSRSSSSTVTLRCQYRPVVSGSSVCNGGSFPVGYLVWPLGPCYFGVGDVTFTESNPYSDGNPVRVDHSTGSTTGWYSGLDNGNGAPLAGYETPQGSGVALGRYWE